MPTRAFCLMMLSIISVSICTSCARDSSSADAENSDGIDARDASADAASDASSTDSSVLPPQGPAPGDATWIDKDTGLEWDNRSMPNTVEIDLATANTQCEDLTLAEHDDWHLPNIDELRSLVRNISPIMSDGKCPTTVACPDSGKCNVKDPACLGCTAMDQTLFKATDCKLSEADLAAGLCYWPQGLNGPCSAYWSSTVNPALFGQASYYVRFSNGIIRSDFAGAGTAWVRCVRASN